MRFTNIFQHDIIKKNAGGYCIMKLYKFLLISDGLIYNKNLFRAGVTDSRDNEILEPDYINQFYTYCNNSELVFMSFKYPNLGNNENAYILVDKDKVYTIVNDIRKNNYHWNSNKDIEGSKQPDIEAAKRLLNALRVSGAYETDQKLAPDMIPKHKIRTGGYVTSGNNKFHEYVLGVSGSSSLKYVHHKGHTFDNRTNFLDTVTITKHNAIHDQWEPQNDIYRAKAVVIGDFCSNSLVCTCGQADSKIRKHDCKDCSSILLIKQQQELTDFITQIESADYTRLGSKTIYKDI
jgi:hypothetical protein